MCNQPILKSKDMLIKILNRKLLYILLFIVSSALNIFAQNALVGPGFSTGWGGGVCPTGNTNFNFFSNSFGSSFGGVFSANGTGDQYFRFGIDWSSTTAQRTITIGSDVIVAPNTEYTLNPNCTTSGALKYNVPNISYKYAFKTFNAGTNPSGKFIFFEVQGAVRNVLSVSQVPIASNVGASSPVTVTAILNDNLNSGQGIYLRYTTNNWTNSAIIGMTGSGTSYTGLIPSQAPGTYVSYYILTSGSGLTIAHENADWYTINGNTNNGSNYSYTVLSGAITVTPAFPTDNEQVTIGFDASGTTLAGSAKVYLHSGVSTKQSSPTSFDYSK